MAKLLTDRLRLCAEDDPTLEPLFAQWSFDKRLTAKALQSVAALFPHYSRHDESHSVQILVNIERVLGEARIGQLSATDVWLLLEAAYLHDIGMVVSKEQQLADWSSSEFQLFLNQQLVGASREDDVLIRSLLKGPEAQLGSTAGSHPLIYMSRVSFLLADFYRRKHPQRAAEISVSPAQTIGLSSPRTELIPSRLFFLLGKICHMHGRPREDLFELPHVSSGLGRDKVHPRFIASLLRIGDLLDLDNNRFCPVMLKVAGDIPEQTHAHIDKHHGIKHLRVDCERIEVSAECSTYQGYVECENWFEYLRAEVAWQMAHWADIVPSQSLGLLPTIGEIRTELRGYELTNPAQRPHFVLDESRVVELLQGAGLYRSGFDSLRELVQNAVDATLLHVWLRHGSTEGSDLPEDEQISFDDSPYDEKVRAILGRYPLRLNARPHYLNEDISHFSFEIIDLGIGISQADVSAMARVGGSYINTWKQEVVGRMPKWMRPSGAFGIGLQSAFLLTDQIIFSSKSAVSGDCLLIRMSNPVGHERGAIYIEKENVTSVGRRAGTKLTFEVGAGKDFSKEPRFDKQDPFGNAVPDFFTEIAANVVLPVIVNGELAAKSVDPVKYYYDKNSGIAVAFDFSEEAQYIETYFRGQRVRGSLGVDACPMRIVVDVFSDAVNVVNVARDHLTSREIIDQIRKVIIDSAVRYYAKADRREKVLLSCLLLTLGIPHSSDYLEARWVETTGYRRKFVFGIPNRKKSFPTVRAVMESEATFLQGLTDAIPRFLIFGGTQYTSVDGSLALFLHAIVDQGKFGYIKSVLPNAIEIGIHAAKDRPLDIERFSQILLSGRLEDGCRIIIPLWGDYTKLACVSRPTTREIYECRVLTCPGAVYGYSPFLMVDSKVTIDNFDKMVRHVFEHRLDTSVTQVEIRQLYIQLIKEVDNFLLGSPKWENVRNFPLPRL